MLRDFRFPRTLVWLATLAGCALLPALAAATPDDYIRPGSRLDDELRILDVLGPAARDSAMRLPHMGIRPLQVSEVVAAAGSPLPSDPAARITRIRLARALERDAGVDGWSPAHDRSTPRLLQLASAERERFEFSAGLEGNALWAADSLARFGSGSGLHVRGAAAFDRWLIYVHLVSGYFDSARTYADPIVTGHDLTTSTDETYLAYTGQASRWGVQFGRSRWHFGPGDEGSLMLSKTSAALTGLAMHARIEPLRADVFALSATLQAAAGEQLAAHRLEWQPEDGLRIGISEAARYHASTWQPLYLVGVVPYVLVQRLQVQDEADSSDALRNNIMFGMDAAWRIAPGTRVYGELLLDDVHARTSENPNKYAYQLGWEGAGSAHGNRLTWGTEYTRVTRYVYTSFFDRSFVAQGTPLGYPFGPDTRRLRVRGSIDPSPDWQLRALAAWTDQGENTVNEPYVPGSPPVDASTFEGVVTRTREVELGLGWMPASGVELAAAVGYRWIDNAAHVSGDARHGATAAASLRLTR